MFGLVALGVGLLIYWLWKFDEEIQRLRSDNDALRYQLRYLRNVAETLKVQREGYAARRQPGVRDPNWSKPETYDWPKEAPKDYKGDPE